MYFLVYISWAKHLRNNGRLLVCIMHAPKRVSHHATSGGAGPAALLHLEPCSVRPATQRGAFVVGRKVAELEVCLQISVQDQVSRHSIQAKHRTHNSQGCVERWRKPRLPASGPRGRCMVTLNTSSRRCEETKEELSSEEWEGKGCYTFGSTRYVVMVKLRGGGNVQDASVHN